MLVELTCPTCGAKFKLDNVLAGPTWTCTGCGARLDVPAASFAETARQPEESPERSLPFDAVRWESQRVAAQISRWAGVLGMIGSLSYGLGTGLIMRWLVDPAGPGAFPMLFQVYLECALVGVIGLGLALGFVIAVAGICRTSRSDTVDWGGTALLAFIAAIGCVLILPLLPSILRGVDGPEAVIKAVFLFSALAALGGHGCLAMGFGKAAARLGQPGLESSAATYLMLLAGLGVWTAVNLFVLPDANAGGAEIWGAVPLAGADSPWINLLVSTIGTAAHYFWFGHIARTTEELIRRRQIAPI